MDFLINTSLLNQKLKGVMKAPQNFLLINVGFQRRCDFRLSISSWPIQPIDESNKSMLQGAHIFHTDTPDWQDNHDEYTSNKHKDTRQKLERSGGQHKSSLAACHIYPNLS